MPKRDSPTSGPPTPAGLDAADNAARQAAIAALLHRLNGGLNNAALAFELALSDYGSATGGSPSTLDRGLAGVEQASRAATLLALMVDPTAKPPASPPGPYAKDVIEILRAHARRIGCGVDSDLNMSTLEKDSTPAATAEALLVGLAALQRAAPANRS